jgi:hypothetical protein
MGTCRRWASNAVTISWVLQLKMRSWESSTTNQFLRAMKQTQCTDPVVDIDGAVVKSKAIRGHRIPSSVSSIPPIPDPL